MSEMTEISKQRELEGIEQQLNLYMTGIYHSLLGVGRCLVAARPLIGWGEWEGWVRENTGMSVRSAQRLMQAARETKAGSAMERLSINKIQMLLELPEEKREEVAEKAAEESLTEKQLRAEINALTGKLKDAEKREQTASGRLEDAIDRASRADAERAAEISQLKALNAERERQLESALAKTADEGLQREVERLEQELREAQEYADEQAEKRQQAQEELLSMRSGQARGEIGAGVPDMLDIAEAVGRFVNEVGVLPHMAAAFRDMTVDELANVTRYVDMVAEWVQGVRNAIACGSLDQLAADGRVVIL